MLEKVEQGKGQDSVKKRDSNLELYRIIVMLLIVAHHYVVNTGIHIPMCETPREVSAIFLFIFGAWGKTGINCFVLITGYFMCKSQITVKKFMKLLMEVELYNFLFNLIFLIVGYETYTLKSFVKALIPITAINKGFTGCYLIFFLCIPFINAMIKNISQRRHLLLIALCMFVYSFLGTVTWAFVNFNYISWFIVLYLVSSYIRLYPNKILENARLWGISTLILIMISIFYMLRSVQLQSVVTIDTVYYYLSDSNKIMAVLIGISSFLFFKNVKIKYSPVINKFGASTFGVLLIHSNSDAMRRFLWCDLLKTASMYSAPYLYAHAVGSVICIFVLCSIIDWCRIRFIEIPVFKLWDKYFPVACELVKKVEINKQTIKQ